MTVADTPRRAGPYTGTGAVSSFPFSFKIFAPGDILVTLAVGGVTVLQTLTSQYSVNLNADQNASPGGTVVFLTPPTSGAQVVIQGDMALTQTLRVQNQGGFYPEVFNNVLDRLVIIAQELRESMDDYEGDVSVLEAQIAVIQAQIAALQASVGPILPGIASPGEKWFEELLPPELLDSDTSVTPYWKTFIETWGAAGYHLRWAGRPSGNPYMLGATGASSSVYAAQFTGMHLRLTGPGAVKSGFKAAANANISWLAINLPSGGTAEVSHHRFDGNQSQQTLFARHGIRVDGLGEMVYIHDGFHGEIGGYGLGLQGEMSGHRTILIERMEIDGSTNDLMDIKNRLHLNKNIFVDRCIIRRGGLISGGSPGVDVRGPGAVVTRIRAQADPERVSGAVRFRPGDYSELSGSWQQGATWGIADDIVMDFQGGPSAAGILAGVQHTAVQILAEFCIASNVQGINGHKDFAKWVDNDPDSFPSIRSELTTLVTVSQNGRNAVLSGLSASGLATGVYAARKIQLNGGSLTDCDTAVVLTSNDTYDATGSSVNDTDMSGCGIAVNANLPCYIRPGDITGTTTPFVLGSGALVDVTGKGVVKAISSGQLGTNSVLWHGATLVISSGGGPYNIAAAVGNGRRITFRSGVGAFNMGGLATPIPFYQTGDEVELLDDPISVSWITVRDRYIGGKPLPNYVKAALPAVRPKGLMIYVTDEAGGEVAATSDGTSFRRVTDRAVVS